MTTVIGIQDSQCGIMVSQSCYKVFHKFYLQWQTIKMGTKSANSRTWCEQKPLNVYWVLAVLL